VFGSPFLEEGVPGSAPESVVGMSDEWDGGDICP